MTISLRDQLLGLGYKPAPKPERKPEQKPASRSAPQGEQRRGGKPAHADQRPPRKSGPHGAAPRKPAQDRPRTREDIDLAKAYAIRAQREKDERIEAERLKQEEARKRREAKAKLAELLQGKGLNAGADEADHVRHFDYGGKIKRVHVTAAQLKALNAGELGVVQLDGRYLLVDAATLAQAEAVFAQAVALKIDPNAVTEDDPYSDPAYQVPDDLMW